MVSFSGTVMLLIVSEDSRGRVENCNRHRHFHVTEITIQHGTTTKLKVIVKGDTHQEGIKK